MNEEDDVFSRFHKSIVQFPVGLINFELLNVANAIPIQVFLARYGRLASCMTANQLNSFFSNNIQCTSFVDHLSLSQ